MIGVHGDQGVACHVHRHGVLLVGQKGVGGFPPAQQNTIAGLVEVGRGQNLAVCPHRVDGGLVDQIGEVRAGEARRAPGHAVQVHVGGQMLVCRVDGEDGATLGLVG